MTILGRLALLFVVVPLLELVFLIQVGRWVGIWPTVGLVFLTGVLGALLARAEGLRTLWSFRRELSVGRIPGQAILDGLSILVGGALLLTPGFLTDVAGFALLLPPSRRLLQKIIKRRLKGMVADGSVRVMSSSSRFGLDGFGKGGGEAEEDRPGRRDDAGAESGRDRDAGDLDPEKEIPQ